MTGLHCPQCGSRFEDDGDRRYDDHCWDCGWKSDRRLAWEQKRMKHPPLQNDDGTPTNQV